MAAPTVVVLHGDQTGEELLQEALRVLAAEPVSPLVRLRHLDLSLAARRRSSNQVVHQAAQLIREAGFGLKAATITPEGMGDVGSPNAILRAGLGADVIVRTGRQIPGAPPFGESHAPITVVRMAVDDAYGAREWREGEGRDEVAFRTSRVSREHCRRLAEYAFDCAARAGATVFGGPKYTVSPVYEGMLKEELDRAAGRHPEVAYEPRLIDATLALLVQRHDALVIPALNRDGDLISDLVLGLYGSLAGSESLVMGLGEEGTAPVTMAEAPHGTAPSLEGRHVANPMAMILAAAAVLERVGDPRVAAAGTRVRSATLETAASGIRTADLGGTARTEEFTAAVLGRLER